MVLAREELRLLIDSDHLKIGGFDAQYLEPATYDMRLGSDAFVVSGQSAGTKDLAANPILIIGASEFALVGTFETLEMPNDIVGHFGLKSSLSRRGLYASVGTQIDPGFRGRLFVSLFNLTPAPIAIGYKDTFLTVEFERLERPPATGYDGANQGEVSSRRGRHRAVSQRTGPEPRKDPSRVRRDHIEPALRPRRRCAFL